MIYHVYTVNKVARHLFLSGETKELWSLAVFIYRFSNMENVVCTSRWWSWHPGGISSSFNPSYLDGLHLVVMKEHLELWARGAYIGLVGQHLLTTPGEVRTDIYWNRWWKKKTKEKTFGSKGHIFRINRKTLQKSCKEKPYICLNLGMYNCTLYNSNRLTWRTAQDN